MEPQFRGLTIQETFFKKPVTIIPPSQLEDGGIILKSAPVPEIPAPDLSKLHLTNPDIFEKAKFFFIEYWPHLLVSSVVIGLVVLVLSNQKKYKSVKMNLDTIPACKLKLNISAEIIKKLKEIGIELSDNDLQYNPGQEEILLDRLAGKMGKTKSEIKAWIESNLLNGNIKSELNL